MYPPSSVSNFEMSLAAFFKTLKSNKLLQKSQRIKKNTYVFISSTFPAPASRVVVPKRGRS